MTLFDDDVPREDVDDVDNEKNTKKYNIDSINDLFE